MAYKEGKCTNCGSLMRFEDGKDNHCIFCWAKNNEADALRALEDNDFVFKNESQEIPTEKEKKEALMSYKTNSHISNSKRKTSSNLPSPKKPQEKGERKISPTERVAMMQSKKLEIKTNKVVLYGFAATFLLVLVLSLALAIPMSINKQERRRQLINTFMKINSKHQDLIDLEKKSHYNFDSAGNEDEITLITKQKIDLDQAKAIFNNYEAALKAEKIKDNTTDVIMHLIHEKSVYDVFYDKDSNLAVVSKK